MTSIWAYVESPINKILCVAPPPTLTILWCWLFEYLFAGMSQLLGCIRLMQLRLSFPSESTPEWGGRLWHWGILLCSHADSVRVFSWNALYPLWKTLSSCEQQTPCMHHARLWPIILPEVQLAAAPADGSPTTVSWPGGWLWCDLSKNWHK